MYEDLYAVILFIVLTAGTLTLLVIYPIPMLAIIAGIILCFRSGYDTTP